MRSNRTWIGVASGVAVGLAITAAVGVSTQSASAQANFTVTPAQLKINQNISSAAVKRSNRALNYLAPIRTTQSDNADDGSNGVKPLSSIPGSGGGWTVAQLAKGQQQYWINVSPAGALTASSGPASGTTAFVASRSATGTYLVDFKTNVSACSWSPSAYSPAPPGVPHSAFATGVTNQPTQVTIQTFNAAGAASDSAFTVQVLC